MDTLLRPHGVGSTQWYILHRLATSGPTPQRDFLPYLQIEKPTLSGVVATLVEKGWVQQVAGANDQRQRVLKLTVAGKKLWKGLPDPGTLILSVAFDGIAEADLKIAHDVLKGATERLNQYTTVRNGQ